MDANDFIVVITTCPNEQEAAQIATTLIEKKFAACVQSNEIHSTYRWKEKVEIDREIRLMIKTRQWLFDDISAVIKKESSYDTPEIISLPIERGSRDYLQWIKTETLP